MHRPSNVDDADRLRALLSSVADVAARRGLSVVFPVHPRTRARIDAVGLGGLIDRSPFVTTEPLGYLDMLRALQAAAVALTDSGGVQEEACILRVPCVTLRANTERPETVDAGGNVLSPEASTDAVEAAVATMLARPRDWANPFGDGATSRRVVDVLLDPATPLAPSGQP
jgi:UDP-N-acetylglucosamine 2-epimerase (non-hydrolysing)